ncbi:MULTISPECIES: ComEA family DNA-binding protein [Bifidobacterium]|jgi:competence protein ComEA|uniref:Helix-hairpin-helix domain-containing protein n=1 Tax=Bifidobacterium tibiigranuli TaxID=2172043 RepID=A0A5N6RWI3_9BIFI|nr:ComEA family DNA-binding protein [Bifidobacterium tibiigranuli]KAE8126542.1 helix-hairpin-helix domain-containing protein [Bifidobacterium tibiigranuli]KAE8126685.1 hypothetical protein DDF78_10670 [Bifidobacterium tibiigranuli]MCH3974386.1 ComEA family DNA-binding protein [Bifidobacterium tibiigranuli]MCH4190047.1 ComEA family DNA-binding protein [Bifidobacterium tibiigranuli]MCH4204702.1 ComEA family DNA-binding protein [Bifidobacterium tibiigranuli]
MSVLASSIAADSTVAALRGPESGKHRGRAFTRNDASGQSGASQAVHRLAGLTTSGGAGPQEAWLARPNQTDQQRHQQEHTQEHTDLPPIRVANRAAHKQHPPSPPSDDTWGNDDPSDADWNDDDSIDAGWGGDGSGGEKPELPVTHREFESVQSGRESFGESRILASRERRDMPRLVAKPWYAVAVMLILVTALCASMTMLIRQSMNYHAATAQQTNATSSSRYGNAADRDAMQPKHSDASQGASSVQPSAPQSTGEPSASAAVPSALPSTVPSASPSTNSNAGGSGLINLNTATVQELDTLAGVGPVTAQRILDHRQRIGRFTSVDQLLDISGIGPKTLEKLRSQVTVS